MSSVSSVTHVSGQHQNGGDATGLCRIGQFMDCGDEPLCVTNHQLHRGNMAMSNGLAESVGRLDGLKASVTESKSFSHQDIRAINAAVEQRAPAGEGLYASGHANSMDIGVGHSRAERGD